MSAPLPAPNLQAMLGQLETLAHIESPSSDPAAVGRVLSTMQRWGEELGGVAQHLSGGSLLLRFGRSADRPNADHTDTDQPVLLLGHADTVWPHGTLQSMPLRREGDLLRGPGVADMKGGLVGGLQAIALLGGEWPSGGIEFLVTPDEEIGSAGSRAHIEAAARRARAALVLEPPAEKAGGYALKTARKGVGEWHLRFEGLAAHAGNNPEAGASAIAEAARAVLALEALARPEAGSTVSVGQISGGSAVNVVPAEAELSLDVRFAAQAEAERISAAVQAHTPEDERVRLQLSGGVNRPPFERTAGTAWLFGLAQEVAGRAGWELLEAGVGGGSDGNFTAPLCPTLDGLGGPGGGLHAAHEHINLPAWSRHVGLLAGLLRALG